jgi:serine phosphatase RsbU (regulator of sigma subunit)
MSTVTSTSNVSIELPEGCLLFITTDGLTDQIGGPKRIAFGKRRTFETILQHRRQPATAICEALRAALGAWQGEQSRRDDVTLFCARLKDNL